MKWVGIEPTTNGLKDQSPNAPLTSAEAPSLAAQKGLQKHPQTPMSAENCPIPPEDGLQTGLRNNSPVLPADLAALVERWSSLPENIRAAILALGAIKT